MMVRSLTLTIRHCHLSRSYCQELEKERVIRHCIIFQNLSKNRMISSQYLKAFHREKYDHIYEEYFFYRNLWVSDDWPNQRWEDVL